MARIKTTTAVRILQDGPYHGLRLRLSDVAASTMVFSVGDYFGRYKSSKGRWEWQPMTR
jgi:hypothetical protein